MNAIYAFRFNIFFHPVRRPEQFCAFYNLFENIEIGKLTVIFYRRKGALVTANHDKYTYSSIKIYLLVVIIIQ